MMPRLSFRMQVLLTASLVVMAVLTLTLCVGWSSLARSELTGLDSRLCREVRRIAQQPQVLAQGNPLLDLSDKLQLSGVENVAVQLRDAATIRWQTHPWLEAASLTSTPWQTSELTPRPRGLQACELTTQSVASSTWRLARWSVNSAQVVLGADLQALTDKQQRLLYSLLRWVIPAALLLTALGAWLLTSLTMKPVNQLRESMRRMQPDALDQRLPAHSTTPEFGELIAAYNTMLARLEASFSQAARFSANAAHELKTPLTILQGRIEQALQQADGPLQQRLYELLEAVQHLTGIIRKLLLLSQADAGRLALQWQALDLGTLLQELLQDVPLLVQAQQLQVEIEAPLPIRGDRQLLMQALHNLLTNALLHGRPDGWVRIVAHRRNTAIDEINMLISNACEPLDVSERARFFERFFRTQHSRQQHTQGHGLGLNLAREIVRAHGGELTLLPSALDEIQLHVRLPSLPAGQTPLSSH